jgi:molybdopterin/thiamine biosynthesis adenylyltransferase
MNILDDVFSRNVNVWGMKKQKQIAEASVLIAGVGGLGCFVSELLVRNGIGKLILIDQGIIDRPDLNRQMLYSINDLGKPKIEIAAKKLESIHGYTEIVPISCDVRETEQLQQILSVHSIDGIADCLDNYQSRFALENLRTREMFLVHGGVQDDYGQVTTIDSSSSHSLYKLYSGMEDGTSPLPVCVQAVSIIASLMVQEIVNNLWEQPKLAQSILVFELSYYTASRIPVT